MRGGLPGGDNSDHFLAAFLVIGMSDKEHDDAARHPQCLPSLLSLFDPVQLADGMRIFKYKRRYLKADLVFGEIQAALLFIPKKTHSRGHY